MADNGAIKEHARRLYSGMESPWPTSNRWSTHTHTSITTLIAKHVRPLLQPGHRILNVGSFGNSYGLQAALHVHTDIVLEPLLAAPQACVADAERLPFKDEIFDIVLCVGSVINYCSAAEVVRQLARVTRPGGHIALEFETSDSFEFMFSGDFAKDVTVVETFYNGVLEKIRVYGRGYIEAALRTYELRPFSRETFHTVSPLAYRLLADEQAAAKYGLLDKLVRYVPIIRNLSANVFVMAQKTS